MRRAQSWGGMAAEFVQVTRHERMEFSFRAPCHLLAVYEQGERGDGETLIEGLPRSTIRNLKGKLTFVPAGHEYYERYEPRVLTRVVYFYLQPEKIPTLVGGACTDAALTPRLFFEDATLWDTALKVKRLLVVKIIRLSPAVMPVLCADESSTRYNKRHTFAVSATRYDNA